VIKEVISEEAVRGMEVLTRAVVTSGTGRSAAVVPDAHGKTGTGEEHKDAWFVGFTPELATAVWVGNRDNSAMRHIFGGQISAPIWADFMVPALKIYHKEKRGSPPPDKPKSGSRDKPEAKNPPKEEREAEVPDKDFEPVPVTAAGSAQNLVRVKYCIDSHALATRYCPHVETRDYLSGQQPTARCTLHRPPDEELPAKPKRDRSLRRVASGDTPRPRRRTRPRRTEPEVDPGDLVIPDGTEPSAPNEPRPRRRFRPRRTTPSPPPEPGADPGIGRDGRQ